MREDVSSERNDKAKDITMAAMRTRSVMFAAAFHRRCRKFSGSVLGSGKTAAFDPNTSLLIWRSIREPVKPEQKNRPFNTTDCSS